MASRIPIISTDYILGSVNWKAPVFLASTINITLALLIAGFSIDGVIASTGNRVLLKDQTVATENGVYDVSAGPPSRSVDFDTDIRATTFKVTVVRGEENAGQTFTCISLSGGDLIGTDDLIFISDKLTGVLPVNRGGTGSSNLPINGVLIGNGISTVDTSKLAPTGDFVGTSDIQTLTNKSLDSPIINDIYDINGPVLAFNGNVPLVPTSNCFRITNSNNPGVSPRILAIGSDTDINIDLLPKGNGIANLYGGILGLITGTNLGVYIKSTVASNGWTLTLPPDAGNSGQLLTTDGAGETSWEDMIPIFGQLNYAATSIATGAIQALVLNTPVELSTGTAWSLGFSSNFFRTGQNRLTYAGGSVGIPISINWSVSCQTSSVAAHNISIFVRINGSAIGTNVSMGIVSSTMGNTISGSVIVSLSTSDFISLYVTDTTASTNLIIGAVTITAIKIT